MVCRVNLIFNVTYYEEEYIELLKINTKKANLIDIDNKVWTGMAYHYDAETNEALEDFLVEKIKLEIQKL